MEYLDPKRTRQTRKSPRPSQPRLVMLTGALPQRSAPTAGAEYVTAVAEELSQFFEMSAIAPAHETNQAALNEGRCIVTSWVVGSSNPTIKARLMTRVGRILRQLDLALPPLEFVWSLISPGPMRSAVREADVIDLQWSEFVSLAPLVRRINPQAVIVGTYHDALTQVAQRKPRNNLLDRFLFPIRLRITALHEGCASGSVTQLRVINNKDAAILATLPRGGDPGTIHPPRPQPLVREAPRSGNEVIFVGAFGRSVNQEATEWLLRDVWPHVRRSAPEAHLVLAGSDPLGTAGRNDVTATGFVEDLSAHYQRASVAVVPLLNGSGVKFKTIDALMYQVPVVTTSIGAEGIEGADLFWAQTDDAGEFAEAIIAALTMPQDARLKAVSAAERVGDRYGRSNFVASVRETYQTLD